MSDEPVTDGLDQTLFVDHSVIGSAISFVTCQVLEIEFLSNVILSSLACSNYDYYTACNYFELEQITYQVKYSLKDDLLTVILPVIFIMQRCFFTTEL